MKGRLNVDPDARLAACFGPHAERAVKLFRKHRPGESWHQLCRGGHGALLAHEWRCQRCRETGVEIKPEVFQLENRIRSDRQDLIILLIVWVVGCGLLWLVAAAGPQVPEDVLRCAQEAAGAGAFEVVDCQGGGR